MVYQQPIKRRRWKCRHVMRSMTLATTFSRQSLGELLNAIEIIERQYPGYEVTLVRKSRIGQRS